MSSQAGKTHYKKRECQALRNFSLSCLICSILKLSRHGHQQLSLMLALRPSRAAPHQVRMGLGTHMLQNITSAYVGPICTFILGFAVICSIEEDSGSIEEN